MPPFRPPWRGGRVSADRLMAILSGELETDPETLARCKLLASLNEEQRLSLTDKGHFNMASELGGEYRIEDSSYSHNVILVKPHQAISFCAHIREQAPMHDHLLAQALALRTNELGFLQVAYPSVRTGSDYRHEQPCDCYIHRVFTQRLHQRAVYRWEVDMPQWAREQAILAREEVMRAYWIPPHIEGG